MKSLEWNGDWEECRAAADRKEFDETLAEEIGKAAYNDYINQAPEDGQCYDGPSLRSTNYFYTLLNKGEKLKDYSERDAKILFLGASDTFWEIFNERQTRGRLEEKRTAVEQCFREIAILFHKTHKLRLDTMGAALSCPNNIELKTVRESVKKAYVNIEKAIDREVPL